MEFISELGLFLAKTIAIVIAIIAVLSTLMSAAARMRHQPGEGGHLETRNLNDHFLDLRQTLEAALLPDAAAKVQRKAEYKQRQKEEKEKAKAVKKALKKGKPAVARNKPVAAPADAPADAPAEAAVAASGVQAGSETAAEDVSTAGKDVSPAEASAAPATGSPTGERQRIFVLEFDGDVQASATEHLSQEVSGILAVAKPGDTVLLRLESPGGVVHGYGLAASQLQRIRDAGITLVAAVDMVAASGGYMMACIADRILAAPFALLGSIGVVVQLPNVHRLLKKHDIDVEMLTAGEHKRTLTMIGENTEEGRQKLQQEINDVHGLFKSHVAIHRPGLDIDAVATGEAWYGIQALEKGLADELITSDAWLQARVDDADLIEVRWVKHEKPVERFIHRFASAFAAASSKLLGQALDRNNHIH